jgi:hypothetical protein
MESQSAQIIAINRALPILATQSRTLMRDRVFILIDSEMTAKPLSSQYIFIIILILNIFKHFIRAFISTSVVQKITKFYPRLNLHRQASKHK